MNELALFSGIGGGILGGHLLGWRTICAVECEPYPTAVLCARQDEGLLPPCPIWSDVRTFDGRPWRGIVDIISGGFPCQDISSAGKGAGITGSRSGLWSEMCRIVREVRPEYVFVENSPMLRSRGLHRVLGDLAESGYHAAWMVLGADECGAPHVRKRIWILAHDSNAHPLPRPEQGSKHSRPEGAAGSGADRLAAGEDVADSDHPRAGRRLELKASCQEAGNVADSDAARCGRLRTVRPAPQISEPTGNGEHLPDSGSVGRGQMEQQNSGGTSGAEASGAPLQRPLYAGAADWWKVEPSVGRMVDGLASRVEQLRAIGNGQVPIVAATAFLILAEKLRIAEAAGIEA